MKLCNSGSSRDRSDEIELICVDPSRPYYLVLALPPNNAAGSAHEKAAFRTEAMRCSGSRVPGPPMKRYALFGPLGFTEAASKFGIWAHKVVDEMSAKTQA
jgi:hypothetical protein